MEDLVRIDPDSQMPGNITSARIQAWGQNYVQSFSLLGGKNNNDVLAQMTSSKGKGQAEVYNIQPGHRVVGIYGYMDSKGDVRGFGLLTAEGS